MNINKQDKVILNWDQSLYLVLDKIDIFKLSPENQSFYPVHFHVFLFHQIALRIFLNCPAKHRVKT